MHRPAAAVVVALAGAFSLLLSPLEAATPKRDYAAPGGAWSILPPGENGSLTFDRNTTDQARLYDGLTALRGNVTPRDLRRFFKPASLGLGADKPQTRERPRSGVTIVRDRFGVAHVTGKSERDVAFGAGWVTAADRGLLLQLIRGPARIAALDVPGLDPLALALSGRTFMPSAEAEAFLANQLDAVRAQGPTGQKILAVAAAYAAGINAWYRAKGIPAAAFTPNDVVASAALIAVRFGANGGREVQNAMFLDALVERLGASEARRIFADLFDSNDPEAPVTVPGSFPYELPADVSPASVVVDDGSFVGAPFEQAAFASNAVLVGAKRSATGHPLFVAGPQVGYFFASRPASFRTRCAGRTARPSSRSFRSRVTDRADPRVWVQADPASPGNTARLTAMTRKRYLMAPGPTPVPPEVLAAGAEPVIHHRGPDFRVLMLRMLGRLQEVCRTRNDVLVFTASGSGAFESAVVNLLSPGERVLAVSAGEFGERWAATAAAYGADVQDLRYSWGETPRPEDVRTRLEETGAEVVFLVHSETSTGVVADVQALAQAAREAGALTVVDAVSSLGAVPVDTDAWGLDVVVAGSQKALMTPPGLSLTTVSPAAWERCAHTTSPRVYFDWTKLRVSLETGTTPYTPAVSLVVSLDKAVGMLLEEGLEPAFARHAALGRACREGAKAMGLALFSPDEERSAIVTAILTPDGVDARELVLALRERFGITVAGGHGELGARMFRIGHIGYYDVFDITTALAAVEVLLGESGADVERGVAVARALEAYHEAVRV